MNLTPIIDFQDMATVNTWVSVKLMCFLNAGLGNINSRKKTIQKIMMAELVTKMMRGSLNLRKMAMTVRSTHRLRSQ